MIEVNNITKEFISAKKYPGFFGAIKGLFSNEKVIKKAVDNVSFSILDGEIVGYIGSNGAGKSTTIKMMTGILTPTSGSCMINGVNPSTQRKKNAKNIGVVFGQRTQLWWDLPLSETYSILKEIYQVKDIDYNNRIEFLNEVLNIGEFWDKPVRVLSLGQRMRADLGASLLHNPSTLYLDEPTIGLDVVVKDNIRKAIKEINSEYNTTVILTTHDIKDIEELCNRIIIIDMGKKIFDGSLKELKSKHGFYRRVKFEVKNLDKEYEKKLYKILKIINEEIKIEFDLEKNLFYVFFDKKCIQVTNIIKNVMSLVEVNDIVIQEEELSDIIRQIYKHKI
ncbi:ABC transporter ATP-binding protein [Anaerosacchariphilus polymeriproducens]|uniref:ATP-binding cassette domain-containing protein n=1 Tax=Anaerosacchariphilus polymeriproducens TaxID=1812858 RepID=A0A371AS33_9FIRM|nr:ATP-binding cassette domain-containing protein [Anaerosacchariphilus polymeriproducens]RDU22378.1 ATP-binding cassette domain-containing protein [Anaerosacchariphilus polymeriproducens]